MQLRHLDSCRNQQLLHPEWRSRFLTGNGRPLVYRGRAGGSLEREGSSGRGFQYIVSPRGDALPDEVPQYLSALVYVSTAAGTPTPGELENLLVRARERNAQEAITGVLLYAEGTFIQYLEGPADGVERVFRIICTDRLHHGIVELFREPIEAREYGEWEMAFAATIPSGIASHFPVCGPLAERLRTHGASDSVPRFLLDAFWCGGVGTGRARLTLA